MQTLFIILGAVAVLILGLFIFSLFLPSSVKIERSVFIPADAAVIFPLINHVRTWELWSPWQHLDPNIKMTYGEKESGAGASFSWVSQLRSVGSGHMTIAESRPDSFLATNMDFMRMGTAKGFFRLEPVTGGTVVTWEMICEIGSNPVRKIMGLMMDKWVGEDFNKGLQKIKELAGSKDSR
ncbi:Polyketide cyclase / dehydrase and lipid transport [Chitinophaga terrae (ex Kim and Jung 2007)]|uniref:Polyketide cyclase / dehydrase and lipid transport n=1 Tax=Chitinophaga terrae (ex Kim and Jung 2007) TaxID=408074 RepID=A0A1H3YRN1_9BACT|nr:SRPBCC family protein [Chitinophaga terrae (ex Kim and Jung 2007)]MDQ0107151.1 hypothetical protein [Chitinophaga terrae (ex Kim and Jung 2007)]GEP88454.1 polyketide cyclase [Chitinophaga terrae (ex Kim and Jung 2007)]SEA13871.1 Polyketide cyclase / dehydrase and lipid transport [Chitinophaga terrae (ex Kim and Jung 2007)]